MRSAATDGNRGEMNLWVVIYRFAWGIVAAMVTMLAIGLFAPKCRQLRQLQGEKIAMEQENRLLAEEIEELRLRQKKFHSDPAFVERTAKDLGMIKSNEFIIKTEPVTADPPNNKRNSRK
jgi:cell division protein FtsB